MVLRFAKRSGKSHLNIKSVKMVSSRHQCVDERPQALMRCFESRFEIAGSQRLIAPLAAGAWSVKLRVSRAIPQVSVLFKTYAGLSRVQGRGGQT